MMELVVVTVMEYIYQMSKLVSLRACLQNFYKANKDLWRNNVKKRIKELEAENDALRLCLNSVSAFEKDMHDNSLKLAKEIVCRDSKAVANIILNMGFGNRNNVSFCEIFGLRENGGCEIYRSCTDCIHSYLCMYIEEKLVCNCTGCIHDGTDKCMHCMRAHSDCYESTNQFDKPN